MRPALRAAALLLALAAWARAHPALDALRAQQRTLVDAPVPIPEDQARQIREATIDAFTTAAMVDVVEDGRPVKNTAASLAQQVASTYANRYKRYGDAKAIAQAVVSLYQSQGDQAAALAAQGMLRKLAHMEERSAAEARRVQTDLDLETGPPPLLYPLLGGLAVLGALVAAYLLIFRSKDPSGMLVADAEIQREAERALQMGIKMLQQGRIEPSVKYFQKVAQLESTLRDRGHYFLALVSLERGDTQTMNTTLSKLDFAAIDGNEAYSLADMLERRGQLKEAEQVFEKLYLTDVGFRDVKTRLDAIRQQAEALSGDAMAKMIAERILDPRYNGVFHLGSGGMGVVFEANDRQRDGVKVAVKVLSPFYANDQQAYTRFVREAEGIAHLDHPNLVKIFDVFKTNLPYYSMEFLQTQELKQLMAERGRLSLADALPILRDVAAGLGHAHEHGITHRDMKPANVLILDDGQAKVIDFGIAKFDEGTQLTVTGQVMGTPVYMSPEQVVGIDIDHRTDIYSIGVMAYQMLSGTVPFETMMQRGLQDAPALPDDVATPGARAAIAKALERKPEDRFQTLQEFIQALEAGA